MKYAIHFADGSKMGCLTLDGAIRLIAHRYRARRNELITDTTETKISVWRHPGEIPIAEVFVSSVMAETTRRRLGTGAREAEPRLTIKTE